MLSWLTQKKRLRRTARALYDCIVMQARQPQFYAGIGVPDTMEGRFEMVLVHLFIVQNRLKAEGRGARTLSQAIAEDFVSEMDSSMRELGVGDLAVPKRMRKIGEAYLGRLQSYADAIADDDAGVLPAALARNVWEVEVQTAATACKRADPGVGAQSLAAYMRATSTHLAKGSYEDICAGRLKFPALQ